VWFCTVALNFLRNLQSSRFAIVLTTEGGAQPPGFTAREKILVFKVWPDKATALGGQAIYRYRSCEQDDTTWSLWAESAQNSRKSNAQHMVFILASYMCR